MPDSSSISRQNVAAVVFNDRGHVLLCKRSQLKKIAPGNWHLPGGQIDLHETAEQALERELVEELSVRVASVLMTPIEFVYSIGSEYHQTKYGHASITGTISLNSENDDYCFVRIEDLDKYLPSDWLPYGQQAIAWCCENVLKK